MNKYFKYLLIILIVAFVFPQITFAAWWNPASWGIWNSIFHFQQTAQKKEQQQNKNPIVGGDKDAHGCIGSAGYSWCGVKQKCLRPWEEACDILSDVYPIFGSGNLKWSNETTKKIQSAKIDRDISGYNIATTESIKNNTDARKFFDYYDSKLKSAGWFIDNTFAADGVTGSQVGYQKDGNYIVLWYNIKPGKVTSSANEPLQWICPCDVTYTIFTTTSTQTDNLSADWKTYANSQYGFTFNYLLSFGNPVTAADGSSIVIGENMKYNAVVYFPRIFLGESQTFNSLMSRYSTPDYTKNVINIGGIKSLVISSPQIGDEVLIPLADGRVIMISGKLNSPLLNLIISTFKFTK